MAESATLIKNTAQKYIKGASDHTIRQRVLLAMLAQGGRIKYNQSGYDLNWNLKIKLPDVVQGGDNAQNIFTEHDLNIQMTLGVRSYKTLGRVSKRKVTLNRGGQLAIVDLFDQEMDSMKQALRNEFCAEIYKDGNGTGRGECIHGFESFLGDDGATTAADRVANPSDTYAGQSTALANNGGSWATSGAPAYNTAIGTVWPYGNGDPEYDCLSPKLLNYTSTAWSSGTNTWTANATELLRRARTWCKVNGGTKMPMMHMLSADMYDELEDAIEVRFRHTTPLQSAVDLGFPDVIQYSGMGLSREFDVTPGVGYGINLDDIEILSAHSDLFYMEGPVDDFRSESYLFLAGFLGNMRCNPRGFAKYAAYA